MVFHPSIARKSGYDVGDDIHTSLYTQHTAVEAESVPIGNTPFLTGVEIVVAGIGTGGTAFGLKKYLPNFVKVYGVEPAESPLFTEKRAGAHKIQGIGANFKPEISKFSELDGILTIKGDEAIEEAKNLAKEKGLFVGISAGANLLAAKQLAKENQDKLIVTIIPDGGDRYLSVW